MEPPLQHLIDRINHVSDQFQELREGIRKAILVAELDPEMALTRSRKVLEYLVRDVFERRLKEPAGTRPLENLLQRLVKEGFFPERLDAYANTVRKLGNVGTHNFGERISVADVHQSLTQLMSILEWYFEVERPEAGARMSEPPPIDAARFAFTPRAGTPRSESHVAVVPKGLRSFDAADSTFFLQLLPGARDENGLPESLRFWKHRIEATDETGFTVGVLYGPSGCGKSSLLKAGLLPRLAGRVITVYVEATFDQTEASLLAQVRKRLPGLPGDLDLVQTMTALRHGTALSGDQKVLVVLDQFEQWLHAWRGRTNTDLVQSLRQCDGARVQCVVMVRDDFWLALSRFLGELDIRLLVGENSAFMDLFDPIHSRSVLAMFGSAYGRLPEKASNFSAEEESFLGQAVSELAEDGKIVSVRLAVFAEMVKGKPWTTVTLKVMGGTEGVGVTFLEETFSAMTAPPEHRMHQKAVHAVLRALLPQSGTDIKGRMRPEAELRTASGYANRSREFADLIRILDHELRLITPTDPEGSTGDVPPTSAEGERHFQLTHDYLVQPLRDWLTRKQKETRRGRAELLLADRAALWSDRPENRHLPSFGEWANIGLRTRRQDWDEPERRMMKRAERVHGLRAIGLAALIALGTWGGIEANGNLRAAALVESLQTAATADASLIINQLSGYRRWAARPLDRLLASTENLSGPRLRASLARYALWPADGKQAVYLGDRLLAASPEELPVICAILRKHDPGMDRRLRQLLDDPRADPEKRFRAGCALASSAAAPAEDRWNCVAPFLTDRFLAAVIKNPSDYAPLIETLRPIRRHLLTPLAAIFRDATRPESERSLVTTLLADYGGDQPSLLADLLMDAEARAYASLFPIAERQAAKTLPIFEAEIRKKVDPAASAADPDRVKDRQAERQAKAAVALVRMGKTEGVWQLLHHSADPRLRSFLLNRLQPLGTDPSVIAAELQRLESGIKRTAVEGRPSMDATLFDPETSMRRTLTLALGTYGTQGLAAAEREALTARLLDGYRNEPDAGIHGACEWTLRQWKQQERLAAADADLMALKGRGDRRWRVNGQGQTFALIDGPVDVLMGSPPTEPSRDADETLHRVRIPRRFAIAAKEVSVEQYQRFVRTNPDFGLARDYQDRYSPIRADR